jgi:proteic killer suppression protein
VRLVLTLLDSVETIEGLRSKAPSLHALVGDRRGYWSITVSRNWRIVFRFEDGDVLDVEFVDYH